jgi:hypothetical protein
MPIENVNGWYTNHCPVIDNSGTMKPFWTTNKDLIQQTLKDMIKLLGVERNGVNYMLDDESRTASVNYILNTGSVVEPCIVHEGISYQVVSIDDSVLKDRNFVVHCYEDSPLINLAFDGYKVEIV